MGGTILCVIHKLSRLTLRDGYRADVHQVRYPIPEDAFQETREVISTEDHQRHL